MMKRRDFISLLNALWLFATGLFLSHKKTSIPSYVSPNSTSAHLDTAPKIVLGPSERFILPANPSDGLSLQIVIGPELQSQPGIVMAQNQQSIEKQTNEIEMDVAGVYLFTFLKTDSFWAIERVENQISLG